MQPHTPLGSRTISTARRFKNDITIDAMMAVLIVEGAMLKKLIPKIVILSLLALTSLKARAASYPYLGGSPNYGNFLYSYNSTYSTYMANSKRLLGLNIWSGLRIDRITTVYTGDTFLSQQYYPASVTLPVGGSQTYMPIPFGERIIDVAVGIADANNTIGFLGFKFQKADGGIYYRSFGRAGKNSFSWWRPNLGTRGAINGMTVRQGKELNFIHFGVHQMIETFPAY